MNCVQCGVPVPDDARFCHSCGSQVSDAEGQARASGGMDDASLKHVEELLREDSSDEFTIHKLLGRGGMALVFLATETRLARKVAIKVLPPELTFGHGVERFMREAKMAAALDHPHIIPVYRIASGSKIFWYAMKYLEGRSLDDVLKEKGKLSLQETIHILGQVADALDYAHEHNVIHRDIKPANVMLDARNRVIVTDFGIAKALTESNLTASGSVVGTPYYMSPEQGMGRGVTGRSDQYSVAVMAYRMISGQVPFEGDSAIDILHKHCMVAPPRLETVCSGLPAHVYHAIHKALEKKPEPRFSSTAAFVEALRRPTTDLEASSQAATVVMPSSAMSAARVGATARRGAPSRPSQPATPPTPIPTGAGLPEVRPTRSRAPVAVGIAAVAVLAVGGWWLFLRPAPPPTRTADVSRPESAAPTVSAPPVNAAAQPAETSVTQPPPVVDRPAPPAPTTGRVMVVGLPGGGMVSVNGRRQSGSTFELAPGKYQFLMGAPGYERVMTSVTVVAGERLSVPYTGRPTAATPTTTGQPPPPTGGTGVLQLAIRPWANVWIGGRNLGQLSRVVDTLIAGTHVIRLEREGYVTRDTTVTLQEGQVTRLTIDMIGRPR